MKINVSGMIPQTAKIKIKYLSSIGGKVGNSGFYSLISLENYLLMNELYQKKGVISMLMKAPVGISLLI